MSEFNRKNPQREPDHDKVELAQFVAEQSAKITGRWKTVGDAVGKAARWLSAWFDKILFNQRHSKFVAFGVALLVFWSFNAPTNSPTQTIRRATEIANVPVQINYNSEMYEVTGFDERVKVTIVGEAADIAMLQPGSDMVAVLDLTGVSEGVHRVKYTVPNISQRLNVSVEPSMAELTVRVKEAQTVSLSYDIINEDKLDSQFVVGVPEFDTNTVTVRASKETMQEIAFVKALIDVGNQRATFETDATVVAYNQKGELLKSVDIVPKKVHVKVPIDSPNKTVPIRVLIEGSLPEGKAIQSRIMDNEAITLYGQRAALDAIAQINIPLKGSEITGDIKSTHTIALPSGIRHGSISKVNLEIKLGDAEEKKFDNISIQYINNVNNLKFEVDKEQLKTALQVYATADNLGRFDKDKVRAYIDLRDVEKGKTYDLPLYIEYVDDNALYYTMKPTRDKIHVVVLEN